jgi:hypothetical protein
MREALLSPVADGSPESGMSTRLRAEISDFFRQYRQLIQSTLHVEITNDMYMYDYSLLKQNARDCLSRFVSESQINRGEPFGNAQVQLGSQPAMQSASWWETESAYDVIREGRSLLLSFQNGEMTLNRAYVDLQHAIDLLVEYLDYERKIQEAFVANHRSIETIADKCSELYDAIVPRWIAFFQTPEL